MQGWDCTMRKGWCVWGWFNEKLLYAESIFREKCFMERARKEGITKAYAVAHDTEIGDIKKIPLWLLGMMY